MMNLYANKIPLELFKNVKLKGSGAFRPETFKMYILGWEKPKNNAVDEQLLSFLLALCRTSKRILL